MDSPTPSHTDDSVRELLVPTDGSPAAEAALERALTIAERASSAAAEADEDAIEANAESETGEGQTQVESRARTRKRTQSRPRIHVLAVADTTDAPFRFTSTEVHELERLKQRLVAEIETAYRGHDVEIRSAIRRGRPFREIVRYADEEDIDLIVLGRTGETGVERLLGSTTDRVVRTSSVPVAVVPEPESGADD